MEKIKVTQCYCCKKIKECKPVFVNKEVRKNNITKTEVTESEIRFVCNSCNHIKPSMDAKPDYVTLGEE